MTRSGKKKRGRSESGKVYGIFNALIIVYDSMEFNQITTIAYKIKQNDEMHTQAQLNDINFRFEYAQLRTKQKSFPFHTKESIEMKRNQLKVDHMKIIFVISLDQSIYQSISKR